MRRGTCKALHQSAHSPMLSLLATPRDHVFRNSGLGATTSPIFASCTNQLVPPDVDLVVRHMNPSIHSQNLF